MVRSSRHPETVVRSYDQSAETRAFEMLCRCAPVRLKIVLPTSQMLEFRIGTPPWSKRCNVNT